MNDSVREELTEKISPIARNSMNAPQREPIMPPAPLKFVAAPPAPVVEPTPAPMPATPPLKFDTAEITAKPTSPTLVDFQNKNAALPDWRLELQNAVRKRRDASLPAPAAEPVPAVSQTVLSTNGSAAVKAEVVAYSEPAVAPVNGKLEGALKRIEESRRRFLAEETAAQPAKAEIPAAALAASAPVPAKHYPFYIATKNASVLPKPPEIMPPATLAPRPSIEDLPIIEKKDLDTNKLKPLPNSSIISSSLERSAADELPEIERTDAPMISISRATDDFDDEDDYEFESSESELEEDEDLAPLGTRFNAAALDLIIGAGSSLILLAPLMLSGGNWFSLAGLLAFAVTCSIVMFIYLTTAVGFFGQTLGMKLFQLEVLDIEEEEYPSLHQAAVNTSVYLVSLAFGGLGLIPVLFNDEKRAAHDLLSGTIVVREEY